MNNIITEESQMELKILPSKLPCIISTGPESLPEHPAVVMAWSTKCACVCVCVCVSVCTCMWVGALMYVLSAGFHFNLGCVYVAKVGSIKFFICLANKPHPYNAYGNFYPLKRVRSALCHSSEFWAQLQ